ncbi:GNAT family N-acetyltransferase [Catellatospora sp. KI3]|uniref:GNAT family N-acetyltransferase n=1 Tax=Catellatospora sp. KI3 TaxID=3041620 RepID=UPI00248257F1|nr:GNAT family N-acetyltransferase [Catellatospora sp. KI3]MDI1461100.1 GNAT family N-acetyltransferase [Catellatospora sp. KI3]
MTIRPARPEDLPALAALCAAHAAYERAPAVPVDLAARLSMALFAEPARLWCLVAVDDDGQNLIGYATLTVDFATWRGRSFGHLDCLYVASARRGSGVGRRLFTEVARLARVKGVDELQWQTPSWNTDAIRFYQRVGATSSTKLRYTLDLAT